MMASSNKRRKLSNGTATAAADKADSATVPKPASTTTKDTQNRSLFVRSLPSTVTSDSLAAHFSESYPLKHATVVVDPATKISRGFGFVTFTDAADAAAAATEFDGTRLDGRKIRVEIAEARHRDADPLVDAGKLTEIKTGKKVNVNTTGERLRKQREDERKQSQPPRLIVRNLPWSVKTGEDLGKLFRSYGKVKHAVVPKKGGRGEQYGFGIVILKGKKNAEAALKGVNGKEVDGRTIAVDWMAEKGDWEDAKKDVQTPEATTNGDAEAVDEEVDEDDVADAVDEDESDADSDAGADPNNPHIDDDASNDDAASDDLSAAASDIDLDDPTTLLSPPTSDAPPKPSTDTTTIFIRNLPYTTDDPTLREHFTTHFGPTRYARVVYDPTTERPRGTGFVCFVHEEDAKTCVRESPKKETPDPTSTSHRPTHQHLTSILQDPTTDPTGRYTLDNRILQISRFLPKETADARASESAQTREKARERDKRRLYLLSEGTVPRGSKLHSLLSKTELDMREASAKQRQRLIKGNANLGLSLVRLSVRNLPRWVGAKELKALAREGVVGFAEDVKAGRRARLTQEENGRGGEEMVEREKERKRKGVGVVKQAKIVYEGKEGGKVKEGMGGRSRGYGFLEYWSHRSALSALRWLNGHVVKGAPAGGEERGKRLIVEFAIENAQVVQRRGQREERESRKRVEGRSEGAMEGGKGGRGGKDRKRRRDGKEEEVVGKGKKQKVAVEEKVEDEGEKNKVAKRNRIIAKKRQARKNRRG